MAAANPLWGAPRIHGELLKLGIDIAERTVSRLIPKRRPRPSQTWRTFLANHVRDTWKGWWGDNPPYHTPVFVLTHHPRAPIEMDGGTTFHFVTDGIHAALARAQQAAGGRDVRLGGGVATLAPGPGRRDAPGHGPGAARRRRGLVRWIDLPGLGYQCTEHVSAPNATHVVLTNRKARSP